MKWGRTALVIWEDPAFARGEFDKRVGLMPTFSVGFLLKERKDGLVRLAQSCNTDGPHEVLTIHPALVQEIRYLEKEQT